MGKGFSRAMDRAFEHHTPGLAGPSGSGTGGGANTPQKPITPPTFNKPAYYAPKQSQLQSATLNPESTSHNYLQRFGVPGHF